MISPDLIGQIEESSDSPPANRATDCPNPVCGRRIEDKFTAVRIRNVINTMALILVAGALFWFGYTYKGQQEEFNGLRTAIAGIQSAQLTVMSANNESLRAVLDEYNRMSAQVIRIDLNQVDVKRRLDSIEKKVR